MSVILDALQRARRENPEVGRGEYELIDRPTLGGTRRRGRWLRRIAMFMLMLVLVAGLGGGAYLGWRVWSSRTEARLYVVPPAQAGLAPVVSQAVASEAVPSNAAVAPAEAVLRVTPVTSTMITISDPVPAPRTAPLAVSTPISQNLANAIGGGATAELPPPVPMSQLRPEADSSLPPPPGSKVKLPPTRNGFVLGTIIGEAGTFIAIVNGTAVRAGRSYGNFKVLRITENEVVVQRDGEQPTTLNPGM